VNKLRIFTVLLASLMMSSCKDPRTEIVVVADTDFAVPDELSTIQIDVTGPDGAVQSTSSKHTDESSLPSYVGLVHTGGPLGPLRVSVRGVKNEQPVVEREAEVSFVIERTLVLNMNLLKACEQVTCDEGQSCGEQGCQPIELESLDEWAGTLPTLESDGDGDADSDGVYFFCA